MSADLTSLIPQYLLDHFGLTGELTPLVAYQDFNYRLVTTATEKYIVKISSDPEELEFVHAQCQVFNSLSGQSPCKPIADKFGNQVIDIKLDACLLPLRVFPFIEGKFLAEMTPDLSFYKDLGAELALVYNDLQDLNEPRLKVQTHEWDLARFQDYKDRIRLISDPEIRRLTGYFFMKHREEITPIYHLLPKGIIHGDPNDWNLIIEAIDHPSEHSRNGTSEKIHKLKGLIDFGDMVYTARIHELAIALAYALMGKNNKMDIAAILVKSYHETAPLTKLEISKLYFLIAARLCTTIVHAAYKSLDQPDSEYHQVSTNPAQILLKSLIKINPIQFQENLLQACHFQNTNGLIDSKNKLEQKIRKRKKYLSSSLSLSYQEPIEMTGSALQYMYSADGSTYLDCVNNIPHVGHCHPEVVEAGQKQMALLNTNTRYIYDNLNDYAENLLKTFPSSLSKVFFVNSGSAATDLAVRLAKKHTGSEKFIVLDHAYHGNTTTAIALSPYKFSRKGGDGRPEETMILSLGNYGLKFKDNSTDGEFDQLKFAGDYLDSKIFIAESIPGCAGQILLDPDFMKAQVKSIQDQGGIYIADEVQTGFGRVGRHFWGFQLYDVVPDIVILGKPIANGHPMGAVVCTEAVAQSFETGMEFFSSFGGNPVSCASAQAVLDVIEKEKLQDNALLVGNYLLKEFCKLQNKINSTTPTPTNQDNALSISTKIADVRGSGLFLGIELVKDLNSMEPDDHSATILVNELKRRGFLLSTDGPDENVIKFKPPLCFSLENAHELIDEFSKILL